MDLKATCLLTLALFCISAPEPDARAIAELSANFLKVTDERALMASETGEAGIAATPAVLDSAEPESSGIEPKLGPEGEVQL